MAGSKQIHLWDQAVVFFSDIFSSVFDIPNSEISLDNSFEQYGIDSILVTKLTQKLEEYFDDVEPTLFFEVANIRELIEFFMENHGDILAGVLMAEVKKDADSATKVQTKVKREKRVLNRSTKIMTKRGYKKTLPNNRSLTTPSSSQRHSSVNNSDIAIIGISGKYAQSDDLYEFWESLSAGKNCLSEVPKERWDWRVNFDEAMNYGNTSYSKWGGFVNNIGHFDASFFNISPLEAERMDPQERLFLEECYKCIENAGYRAENLSTDNAVGVYVGVMNALYPSSAMYWSIANRISYIFDFHGPSMAVDTACSSSLTSIFLACENIRNGYCDIALAGGVNLIQHPTHLSRLCTMRMLSPSNKVKAFGEGADGFVDGEGVGVILLKNMDQAIADGDYIHGVIKSTSVNSAGRSNAYTVPNVNAQTKVIEDAWSRANVESHQVSYIEAHGTGTALGDPIEIRALNKAMGDTEGHICRIGSVKTNIGHCESASGIASVSKVLLQMKHRTLVPSLNADSLNPLIDFDKSPLSVQTKCSDWQVTLDDNQQTMPRIAGVSSFGAGGANAHIVLQEYDNSHLQSYEDTSVIILLSAINKTLLLKTIEKLLYVLQSEGFDSGLANIAYTLQTGRNFQSQRLAFRCSSMEELKQSLLAYINGEIDDRFMQATAPPLQATKPMFQDDDILSIVDQWIDSNNQVSLAKLWLEGGNIDWHKLYDGQVIAKAPLPTIQFNSRHFWYMEKTHFDDFPVFSVPGKPARSSSPVPLADSKGVLETTEEEGTIKYYEPAYIAHSPLNNSEGDRPRKYTFLSVINNELDLSTTSIETFVEESIPAALNNSTFKTFCLSDLSESYEMISLYLFDIVKKMMLGKDFDHYIVLSGEGVSYHQSMILQGLSKIPMTAASESNRYQPYFINLFSTWRNHTNSKDLITGAFSSIKSNNLIFTDGNVYSKHWKVIDELSQAIVPWRENGVYLITGGLGGLGMIFTDEILRKCPSAKVILTGRRQMDENIEQRLKDFNGDVTYQSCDISVANDVRQLIAVIDQKYGRLNAIIHSAGASNDSAIRNKNDDSIMQVLSPKVSGLSYLDQQTAKYQLDFFALFSSVAAAIVNPGQSDYACANAFMDAFSSLRNNAVNEGKRHGQTLSINWPLWSDGGMQVDGDLESEFGVRRLQEDTGIATFYQTLSCPQDQVLILSGTENLHDLFTLMHGVVYQDSDNNIDEAQAMTVDTEIVEQTVEMAVINVSEDNTPTSTISNASADNTCDLRQVIADILKYELDEIDTDLSANQLGFDSITALEFLDSLSDYGYEVPIAQLFEADRIVDVLDHNYQLAS